MQPKTIRVFIAVLIFILLFVSVVMIPAGAAEATDHKLFTFTSDSDIKRFTAGQNAVALSIEDSFLRIDFTGDENPLFYTVLDESARFKIKDYPIIKIKYYTNSPDDIMILYYGFEENATRDNPLNIDAKQAYSADIKRGEWSEVTVDLSKIRTDYPVGCVFYNNDVFCIAYIGFFKTVADADAYQTENGRTPSIAERAAEETIAFPPFDLSEVDYSKMETEIETETAAASDGSAITETVKPDETSAPDNGESRANGEKSGMAIYYIIGAVAAALIAAAVFIKIKKSREERRKT